MKHPNSEFKLDRRGFLSLAGGIAAAAGLSTLPRTASAETEKPIIAVANGSGREAVEAALSRLGGMKEFIKPGAVVVLKPNISFPNPPAWGTTTSPELVKAAAEICLEAGAKKVVVVDNPLGTSPTKNVERSGIGKALEGLPGVDVMMIAEQRKFTMRQNESMSELKSVEIARILDKADILINLPTAKSHVETGVSLGLKNLMGLIWDRKVFHQTYSLDRAIAQLLAYIRPGLTIMDASRALLNNGPVGPGRVENIGKVVAGTDPVAVDSYTLTLAEFNLRRMTPALVPHIGYAAELGLGIADWDKMEIVEA